MHLITHETVTAVMWKALRRACASWSPGDTSEALVDRARIFEHGIWRNSFGLPGRPRINHEM